MSKKNNFNQSPLKEHQCNECNGMYTDCNLCKEIYELEYIREHSTLTEEQVYHLYGLQNKAEQERKK